MKKIADLQCWKCGEPLDYLLLPLSRTATCKNCGAHIHVCKMCEFYNPHIAKSCKEPVALEVKDKQRANFCDYLQLKPNAYIPQNTEQQSKAKSELDALFGLNTEQEDGVEQDASQADKSRQALDDLFGLGKDKS